MLVPRRVLLQTAGFLVLDDFIQMNNMRLRDAENLMLNFLTGQLSNEQNPGCLRRLYCLVIWGL